MKLGVPKEMQEGEDRVAASPDTVKRYAAKGVEVVVQNGAGLLAGFSDQQYEKAGAKLTGNQKDVYNCDIVLKVQRPTPEENGLLQENQILIGALDPYMNRDQLNEYASKKVTSFSLELLPRTTRAQAMDILSSQANLAGYKAVIDSMAAYNRVMPMMMTAAGTVTPAKIFIIGAGVAGLQAIATARRMGAVVTATDVRPASREEIASLGAKFVGFIPEDAATSGGYARALTKEEQQKQAEMVADHIKSQDIVITTAQIPGRQAPRIVTDAMVQSMKPGSVLFDLAAETGGNVEGSVAGESNRLANGVNIIGAKNLAARLAPATSTLFAKNLLNFCDLLIAKGENGPELTINEEDELIAGSLVTKGGAIVHPNLKNNEN